MSFKVLCGGRIGSVTGSRAAEALLGLPVRVHGIELGRPVDVVLDLESRRAIGLEVRCPDDARRFLPLAAARLREDEVAVGSALLLLDEREVARVTFPVVVQD